MIKFESICVELYAFDWRPKIICRREKYRRMFYLYDNQHFSFANTRRCVFLRKKFQKNHQDILRK